MRCWRRSSPNRKVETETTTEPGLYTGLAGIGFVLGEVWRATGQAVYRDGARRVVARLQARAVATGAGVEWNDTTDIISGSAGIGLFLLHAADALDLPEARALAAARRSPAARARTG